MMSSRPSRKRSRSNLPSSLSNNGNTIHNEAPFRKEAKVADFDTIKKVNPKDEAIDEKDENNSSGTE